MELQSGQEVLANELEQQQATLVVSELAESEQAALEGSLDAPQVSGGELGSEVHYANADLGDLIDDGQTSKLTKVFDSGLKGDGEYVQVDDDGNKRKAKSDLKRESIEEKKQLQKEEQKIEKRAVIKFLTLRGKSGAKIHRQLKEVYGDQAPSLRNVNFWRLQFLRGGRLRLRNAEKCGRRATATTQENIEAARNYIELNPHAKISDVGKEIGVSHGTAFRILHEHLKLQNFGGKWIPASLKVDGQLHASAGGDNLVYTNYEADSGLQEHFVYTSSAGPRRHGNGGHAQLVMHAPRAQLLGATSSQRGMRAGQRPHTHTHTQRVMDASGKQPVSVVTVHPRARRGGSSGAARRHEYVKSEMDEMNAMVTDYFELDDAAQQAEQGAEVEGGEGEGDGQSGSMVMGVGPDGNLYVVSVGEGAEGGENQDGSGGYVVQETSGYVVEETNYINYPETSM